MLTYNSLSFRARVARIYQDWIESPRKVPWEHLKKISAQEGHEEDSLGWEDPREEPKSQPTRVLECYLMKEPTDAYLGMFTESILKICMWCFAFTQYVYFKNWSVGIQLANSHILYDSIVSQFTQLQKK